MPLRRRNNPLPAWRIGALATLIALGTPAVHAFFLISPISYWPATSVSGNIVFEINLVPDPPNIPNPPLLDGSTSWDAAFVAMLDQWNANLPDNVLVLQGNVGSAAVPAANNGINNVFFSSTIYGDSWGSSTLGICLSRWSGNERTEADVLFNSTKTWNAYTGNLQGGTSEFRRVALHELGHALVLDHPDDAGQSVSAIMNSSSSNTDALTADDIAGVTAVFGALQPVTITSFPSGVSTVNGSNASFSVDAVGSEPMTYTWERSTNGGSSWSTFAIPDTFRSFNFGPFNNSANGQLYRVTVTNPVGSLVSRSMLLTVTSSTAAPVITSDPVNVTATEFDDVIFTIATTGSPTPTIAWEFSQNDGSTWSPMFGSFGDTDVFGANSSALKLTRAISAMDGFQFRAVVTNSAGSDASTAATLTLPAGGPASYFTWQPLDVYAQAGSNAMFVAGIDGSPNPGAQWQRSTDDGATWNNVSNNATFAGATTSTLTITAVTTGMDGDLFRLNATNSGGDATSRVAALSVAAAPGVPDFNTDPIGVTQPVNATATFSTVVSALPAPVFQWQASADGVTYSAISDGGFVLGAVSLPSIVSGANSRDLSITNLNAGLDGYRFRLVATNAPGSATSSAAILTIGAGNSAPFFTTQPSNATRVVGQNATFVVAASGNPAPTLQWQRSTNSGSSWANLANDATFSGVTGTTLTVASVTLGMSGHQFRAVATNSESSVNSTAATLTVEDGPQITTQPANTTRLAGENATFTAAASGTPAPTLQWQRSTNSGINWTNLTNTAPYSGVTTGTLTVTGVTITMTGDQFRVVATNNVNSVNSTAAILTVNVAPAITTQPSNATRLVGEDATFTAAASGTPSPALQWQRSINGGGAWTNLSNDATFGGVTTGTLTVTSVTLAMSGHQFRVVATNVVTSTNSTGATLTVNSATPPNPPASPTSGATAYDSFTAQWAAVTGATGYRLDVATDAAFTNLVAGYNNLDVGNVTSRIVSGLGLGTYYVRVRAYNAGGTSSSSTTSSVAVGSRLLNLSTRGQSSSGDPMIVGFYVSGSPKTLLIRVAANALAVLNVPGTLPDPRLRLVDEAENTVATNDNWDASDPAVIAAVAASGAGLQFASGSNDSVIVATDLPVGGYTAVVESVTGESGVVLVELYEIDEAGRLINISTRGFTVTAGADVMIPGTFIGPTSKRLLIRVVGETLSQFIGGVLEDPILEIYDGDDPDVPFITNDDWDVNDAALKATWTAGNPAQVAGLGFADGSKDAAVLVVLPKNNGGYTVLAKGKNGASGTVLVEIYEVP